MTEIEQLITKYPDAYYDDDTLFRNIEDWGEDIPLEQGIDSLIDDYFEGMELLSNPNEKDPQNALYEAVSGRQYVKETFKNYTQAIIYIKANIK